MKDTYTNLDEFDEWIEKVTNALKEYGMEMEFDEFDAHYDAFESGIDPVFFASEERAMRGN